MFKFLVSCALVLGSFNFAFADHHEAGGGGHDKGGPCANDAEKLCPGVEHGGGRVMKCLKEHKDKLSVACKGRHEMMKTAMKDVKEACHDDADKFCGDVKPGKGRIMDCMKSHKDELSQSCKDELAEKKAARKAGK